MLGSIRTANDSTYPGRLQCSDFRGAGLLSRTFEAPGGSSPRQKRWKLLVSRSGGPRPGIASTELCSVGQGGHGPCPDSSRGHCGVHLSLEEGQSICSHLQSAAKEHVCAGFQRVEEGRE